MGQFLAHFLLLPDIVLSIIFSMLGAGIGTVIILLLPKKFKSLKSSRIIMIVCILIAIQLGNYTIPSAKKEIMPLQVMNNIKANRFFALVFQLHPEAEKEMRLKIEDVLHNSSDDQILPRAAAVSTEMMEKYFNQYILTASDDAIHRFIQYNSKMIDKLHDRPKICVGYYVQNPQIAKDWINHDYVIEISNLRADIVESAVNHPSQFNKASNLNEITKIMIEAYQNYGYNPDHLKITQVETQPPEEGCQIAYEFYQSLNLMDPKKSAYIFKNLIYFSQQN